MFPTHGYALPLLHSLLPMAAILTFALLGRACLNAAIGQYMEMVLHVVQVVSDEKSERTRFVWRDRARGRQAGRAHIANEHYNLAIVKVPKLNE